MTERWAYGAVYLTNHDRRAALPGFLDHYNYRRPHRALDRQPPIQRLAERNNLAGTYTEDAGRAASRAPVEHDLWMPTGPSESDGAGLPADFDAALLAEFGNGDLLTVLDRVLLELEQRLLRYARAGPDILEMADEGLVLAIRAGARLRQAASAGAHAAGHLQIVGVGGWAPRSTQPVWSDDPRVTGGDAGPEAGEARP